MRSYGIPSKMARIIADIYKGLECTVTDGSETSDWFKVECGVKVMSGFLFLLALDWTMRKVAADKRRGIQWNFTTVLEDLDLTLTTSPCCHPSLMICMRRLGDWQKRQPE